LLKLNINNAMLVTAPKFEVAKRIIEITTDCIIVAHNACLIIESLRTEFRRLGQFCHIMYRIAKKLIPEQPSTALAN
jgi:DNA polymerase-3 subunit epsilon